MPLKLVKHEVSLASAQIQDITPPTLTALSFTPTTINTATGPANVTVSLSATDDLSGVRTINILATYDKLKEGCAV